MNEFVGEVSPSYKVENVHFFHPESFPRWDDFFISQLEYADDVDIAVAFIPKNFSNRLFHVLFSRASELKRIRVLTSTMNFFNAPETLEKLRNNLPSGTLKLFTQGDEDPFKPNGTPFHVKAYLFNTHRKKRTLLIGSSNLTNSAIHKNVEWNTAITVGRVNKSENAVYHAQEVFDRYWDYSSISFDETVLKHYQKVYQSYEKDILQKNHQANDSRSGEIVPTIHQKEALKGLSRYFNSGESRAAIVAPTGFGKTYLSAFFIKQNQPEKVLFIVHREAIIEAAKRSFKNVLGNTYKILTIGGNEGKQRFATNEHEKCIVFAMVQSLSDSNYLNSFNKLFFDLIILDEFHHASSDSYKRIINYFKPRFLFGMTATPERMDGKDILDICYQNVAYEMRLFEAIEKGVLSPFQYFAIKDSTDYTPIRWNGYSYNEQELVSALSNDTRVELICSNLSRFIPSFGKIKALAFCASVSHARWMEKAFTSRGYSAISLSSSSTNIERERSINELQNEKKSLQIICSVDIFSEGIDIPELTHILLLRPTQSATVFLQQLGRGLRKIQKKDFLVVLDFIGNYQKNFIAPLIFQGDFGLTKIIPITEDILRKKLPTACSVDTSTEVVQIWNEDIERKISSPHWKDQFKFYYESLKEKSDDYSKGLSLLDYYHHPLSPSVSKFLSKKKFSNWLRAREYAGDLAENEKEWLNTPAEKLLQHIEAELNSVKSYKMVVLEALLHISHDHFSWKIEDIALYFHRFYISDELYLYDYIGLHKFSLNNEPKSYPISKVLTKLKNMPLLYLSNSEKKPFILSEELFILKEPYHIYWDDKEYQKQLLDRVRFARDRYFSRKLN